MTKFDELHKLDNESSRPQNRGHRLRDAGARLGLSPSSIYRHAAAGKIQLVRVGGRTLITDAEIARLLRVGAAVPARHVFKKRAP
jgi:hypothetical protein